MPRPAVIQVVNWQEVLSKALDFRTWLEQAEFPENAEKIVQTFESLALDERDIARMKDLPSAVHVLAFAEDWCGDVVRHVPVLEKLVSVSDRASTCYLSREDAPELFVRFLTNGGEAVPKFVFISDNYVECANWGPMQTDCRQLIAKGKACGDVAAARSEVARRYQEDLGQQKVIAELVELFELAATAEY